MAFKIYQDQSVIVIENTITGDTRNYNPYQIKLDENGDIFSIYDNLIRNSFRLGGYLDIVKIDDTVPTSFEDARSYLRSFINSPVSGVIDGSGNRVNVQYPISSNGDSVYVKDIDFENSDFGGFVGDSENLFKSPFSQSITNNSIDNPKQIILAFNRTVKALQVGLGENNGGDFSNVKISLLGSGGIQRSVFDESSDNTKRTSRNAKFENELFNSLLIEFFTSDIVSLSNITIQKAEYNTSQIEGKTPSGDFKAFNATERGNFKISIEEYGDTPSIDAFARLRVSDNFTIFDSKQLHDKQPLFWDEKINGSATSVHLPDDAATRMSVSANEDYVIRQTRQRFNYQPGKSQLIFFTFFANQSQDVIKRVGLFDDDLTGDNLNVKNGIFLQINGQDVSWNIAKNGNTNESISQNNWNFDKLNGSAGEENPSLETLNLQGSQIGVIDYEWLGVGRVRVGFVIDGIIRYCHYFNHANSNLFQSVYMSTPNLPLRYDIQSIGGNGYIDHICGTVISEGGIEKTGILRSIESNNVFTNTLGGGTGVKHALCSIRLKDVYKDISVIPEGVEFVLNTGDNFKWELHLNPVINGTWTYNDLENSSVQFAQVGTSTNNTILSDGLIIARGGGSDRTRSSEADLKTALRIGSDIAGNQDELVLVLGLLDNNQQVWACLNFRELL